MTESQIQAACFQWIWNEYPQLRGLCWHVPNEGKRSRITGNRLKAAGLVAGVPDLEFHYFGRSYFFELKTEIGRQTPKQKTIQKKLENNGFNYYLIRSFSQFKEAIIDILNPKPPETMHYHDTTEAIKKRYKIFEWLHITLEKGHFVKISDICTNETKQYFIEQVKLFIISDLGRVYGFYIEFTPDFKELSKKEYFSNASAEGKQVLQAN